MAEKESVPVDEGRRQSGQPVEVALIEFVMGGAVGQSHAGRVEREKIAVMIAAYRSGTAADQDLRCPRGIQRAAQMIAKIDDLVDALCIDVGKHGLEREIVAVNIGNHRDSHARKPQ